MDQGLPWGQSPIDLPASAVRETGGLGWAFGVVVISSLILPLVNAHALANWADQLPVEPRTAPIVAAADAWQARARDLGLTVVVDRTATMAAAARKTRWPAAAHDRINATDQR